MEWSTHMLSGVVAGYVVTGGDYRGAIVGGIAGVIPDLDEPKSKFGKLFFPISYPINSLIGHRTLTHSLIFSLLLGLIFYIFTNWWIALAVSAGIIAHAIGDMVTGTVKFFYPLKKSVGVRIHLSLFKPIDRITRYTLLTVVCLIAYREFTILINNF